MKIKIHPLLCALSMSIMLSACGGGESSALENTRNVLNGTSSSSSDPSDALGADTLQSIEFVDAAPTVITLKGTGGTESSLIRFRVLGKTGTPIKNINVDFALNTKVGGLDLSQLSSKSDADGYVSTSVISGTVATTVRVTATTTTNATITTQSNQLVVATGLPDQKSMSISAEKFSPNSWGYNNIQTSISVLLADAYNNPAADGTAISFTTEGGSIQSGCVTTDGGCNVKWTSQDPRPQRKSSDNSIDRILCLNIPDVTMRHTCEAERAGRITILATAIGNESFKDTNGNGIYDFYDLFATEMLGNCTPNTPSSSFESSTSNCDDLSEAFLDKDESNTRDPDEPFVNFVSDKTNDLGSDNYSQNNGIYNGIFCPTTSADLKDEAHGFCSRKSITIRKDIVIVMACDEPLSTNAGRLPSVGTNVYALADCNGNSLPVGTKIKVGTSEEVTLGNSLTWMVIGAASNTLVKLTFPVGNSDNSSSKIVNIYTE